MSEFIALVLPAATALLGMRLIRLLLGAEYNARFGFGLRFAVGLGAGMLVLTQLVLLGALIGLNLARGLAFLTLAWGALELGFLAWDSAKKAKRFQLQWRQLWLLLLLPLVFYFWVWARMAVVEGAMEFDGLTYWLFKGKVLYLKIGSDLLQVIHTPRLAYAHWDYPMLVPGLYTLSYGALGGVNEFMIKPWPVWMVLSLCLAILSLGDVWRRPRALPIATVLLVCLLPGTLYYIHREGGTVPMLFHAGLAMLLIVRAWTANDVLALAAAVVVLAGGAMTKFEGILYAAIWSCVLVPICWRRGWLKNVWLLRALGLAVLCMLPYGAYRLEKPVLHPESSWVNVACSSPGPALARFPVIAGVGLARCSLNEDFAKWTETADGHLKWVGTSHGLGTLNHYLFHWLPASTVLLLLHSLRQRRYRRPALALTGVVGGVFAFLVFVLACVWPLFPQGSLAAYTIAKTGEDMIRYTYPFLIAWFLGVVSLWFAEELVPEVSTPPIESSP